MQWSCSVTVQFPQNIAKRSFSKVSSSYADDGEGKSGKTCFRNGPMPHTNKKIQCFCRNNIADSIVFIKPPLRLVYYPNRLFFFAVSCYRKPNDRPPRQDHVSSQRFENITVKFQWWDELITPHWNHSIRSEKKIGKKIVRAL